MPLPRGAAVAMIRSVGSIAGLKFEDATADFIASSCSDMPFWIRKACSFVHTRTDTLSRPLVLQSPDTEGKVKDFIRDEGADMAQVALQHLFRVYPELKEPALKASKGRAGEIAPSLIRILTRYGLTTARGDISGEMLHAGLLLIENERQEFSATSDANVVVSLELSLGEWAEELQAVGKRRNLIERKLREIVFNFIKFSALASSDGKSAKDRILESLPAARRKELSTLSVDDVSQRIYWLELSNIIRREWKIFERVFGDQQKLLEHATVVNERPDAHAKSIDMADVALYRRSLSWFEDRLARL